MQAGAEQAPVKVRNLSSTGALIETPIAPVEGTTVHLLRGPLIAEGTVIWSSSKRCGLRFSSEVSLKDWLAAPAAVHQQRVDEMVALAKAGQLSGPPELAVSQDVARAARLQADVQGDLEAVIALLQDLENDVASSSETVARHGMKLQNLDLAMQMLRAMSAETAPDSTRVSVSSAKLKDLRVACATALGPNEKAFP